MRMNKVLALALTAGLGTMAWGQTPSHSDKEFLEKASQGNVAQVEFAKLALSKTSDPRIQGFAKKMIHDHEMLARTMKPFVVSAGLQPATRLNQEHQDIYNRLKRLSEPEFDKEYVDGMDKDHHSDLKAFKEEIASTPDAPLKATLEKGEALIAEHTEMVDGLAK